MARSLLIIACFIALPFAAAIGVIRARPIDNSPLAPLLESPDGCALPCWMGIHPGETTYDDAMALLAGHEWVGGVYSTLSSINWEWSGLQASIFDMTSPTFQGRMALTADDRVSAIVMQTHLRFGDIWMALGKPDQLVLGFADQPVTALAHIARYNRYDLHVFMLLRCPMTSADFWNAPVIVSFGKPALPYIELVTASPYTLPGWFFRNTAPGCA